MSFHGLKIISIDQWNTRQHKKIFLDRLVSESFDKIYIFTQNEFQYYTVFDEFMPAFFGHYIESKKLNVDLITSLPPESDHQKKYNGLNVHYWDTYWLTKTFVSQQQDNIRLERQNQLKNKGKLQYHFIMMNNRAHDFRAKLIDEITRLDLLKFGVMSWHDKDNFLLNNYKFKYFDGQNRILDTSYNTLMGGQYNLPDQYFESFAQLISESTPDILFFSEKISMALLNGKIFLAAAAPGMHLYLNQRLGIKYYDEVFDYSFDLETDMNIRWAMIAENFKKLCSYSLAQLEDLQNLLEEKVKYNQQRALEVVNDTSRMPLPIRELYEAYKNESFSLKSESELANIFLHLSNLNIVR